MRSVLLLLFIFLTTQLEASTSAEALYQKLGIEAGQIKLIRGKDNICADGPLKVVGQRDEEILMVGPKITFSLPQNKPIISETEPCREETNSQYQGKSLLTVTTVSHCDKENKKLESKVTERLEVKGKELTYTRDDQQKRVQCIFTWSKDAKK